MKPVFALSVGLVVGVLLQSAFTAPAGAFTEKVLYSFCSKKFCTDGAAPIATLTNVKGTLYGTTNGGDLSPVNPGCCGTVFSIDPDTGIERTVHSFCSQSKCVDGAYPVASLNAVNGVLYGTTNYGGGATGCGSGVGCGTVFALDPNTGVERVIYAFCNQQNCADGAYPVGNLIKMNGLLYGTTKGGGHTDCSYFGCGTVFSIDPNTGTENVLHSFAGGMDGWLPLGGLIAVNGKLYGTANGGGGGNGGSIFAIDPDTGAEGVVYSFCSQPNCADGEYPNGSLIAVNGTLYGTTLQGGSSNCSGRCGTVFSFDPTSGAEAVLHTFLGGPDDGQWPIAGVSAVKGKLYGTTWFGGAYHTGAVFAVDLKTGTEKIVYSFCSQVHCPDGGNPEAAFVEMNGELYGTTQQGGAADRGTVFVLTKRR